MQNLIFCLLLCAAVAQAQHTTPISRPIIGDEVSTNIQTAHPYNSAAKTGVIFEQEFYNKNSAYIKLYFEDFDLGPNDYVEISTHNTGESIIYAGKGKIIDRAGTMLSDFWSQALLDERVTVRLHAQAPSSQYGFKISKVAYGYSAERIDAIVNGKSICSTDDKERIVCYNNRTMFTRGKAVCKLIIGGSGFCTGWLLGCEGHVMTNNHCVGNATDAANTDFIFDYEHSNCTGPGLLTANTVASSATLVRTHSYVGGGLDYSLLLLPTNPTGTYGYLSLSSVAPQVGDQIYIIGHPGGRPKEITVTTDVGGTPIGMAAVDVLTPNGMGYYADTEVGNSGSPVFSAASDLVYSLHSAGGCTVGQTNGSAVRCDVLIGHLGADMPKGGVDYSAGCTIPITPNPNPTCTRTIAQFPYSESFESTRLGGWTNSTADDFDWTRTNGATPTPNTGPTAAYDGQLYMYAGFSGSNNTDKWAYFISPCFDLSSTTTPQISFSYHMHGTPAGGLRLDVSTDGNLWTPIWSVRDDQGNAWNEVTIPLYQYNSATRLQFRFARTTGQGSNADTAIDDIRITDVPVPTCNSSYPLNNSFETGFEGWTNDQSGDNFDWLRKKGSTPTNNTGPSSAQDGKHYIYTEATFPNYSLIRRDAIIASPCQDLTGLTNPAVAFAYHMYGLGMGDLHFQVSVNDGPWTTIWTRSRNHGNTWHPAYIDVSAYKSSNTRFRFFGSIYAWTVNAFPFDASDMAVDNFFIMNGRPNLPPRYLEQLDEATKEPFLTVHPNPFDDYINIETDIEGLTQYHLTNLQGQVIQQGNLQRPQIQLADLVPGVYFITLYNEEEQHVRKLIKQ